MDGWMEVEYKGVGVGVGVGVDVDVCRQEGWMWMPTGQTEWL